MKPRKNLNPKNGRFHAYTENIKSKFSNLDTLIDEYLFNRFERLQYVKRFVFGWLGLILVIAIGLIIENITLNGYYQTLRPVPGGIYNEGVLGRFTNANPLYATNNADTTVSHLIFSGLLKYNSNGQLTGDLASSYSESNHGLSYTVHLKPNLKWQDGKPLTSSDVIFTYKLIQNPDTGSPLQSSWSDIKIYAPDSRTIVFNLPGTLASFPYNLTNGIVPQHLLGKIAPVDIRSANFNTVNPVGSGPFSWKAIEVSGSLNNSIDQIALLPNSLYAGGKPKLDQLVVRAYSNQNNLLQAFDSGQLTSAEGIDSIPRQASKKESVIKHNLSLRAANMVFFKTTDGVLKDRLIRNGLVEGADVYSIVKKLDYSPKLVNEPLLSSQLAYNPAYAQPAYNPKSAIATLNSSGWNKNNRGILTKNNQELMFTLTSADTPEDHIVASNLQKQWASLGVRVTVDYLDKLDFQNAINYHTYDAVLYGITIGEDPDVYVYWDSSQADIRSANRLNLSEYNNPTADASLEAARSRLDPAIRSAKYAPFLQVWQQDTPALALYQPRLIYLTNGIVYGLNGSDINSPTDRFANVQNWEIRQARVTN